MPAGPDTMWTQAEIAAISAGHRANLTPGETRERYGLNRSPKAIRMKRRELGMLSGGSFVLEPIRGPDPVREDKLLPALLSYGLRHNVDLGMGASAFYAACAQHGVRV